MTTTLKTALTGIGYIILCSASFWISFQYSSLLYTSSAHYREASRLERQDWMHQREQIYAARKRRISELCRRYEKCDLNKRKQVDQFKFWFDQKNRMAVCMNSKVGSSTLKRNFPVPSNLTSEEEGQDSQLGILGALNMREERGEMAYNSFTIRQGLLRISFARDPLERLVSVYEDTILDVQSSNKLDNSRASFPTFVQNVIECAKREGCDEVTSSCRISEDLRSNKDNCFHCQLEYDVIGRIGEYDEDMRYIAQKLNLTSELLKEVLKNTPEKKSAMPGRGRRVLKRMSELSHETKRELYEVYYKIDAEMFGHDAIF